MGVQLFFRVLMMVMIFLWPKELIFSIESSHFDYLPIRHRFVRSLTTGLLIAVILVGDKLRGATLKILNIDSMSDRIALIGPDAALHGGLISLEIDNEDTLLLDNDVVLLAKIVNEGD